MVWGCLLSITLKQRRGPERAGSFGSPPGRYVGSGLPLYASTQAWEEDFQLLLERFPKVAEFRGHVAESAATLLEVLEFEKGIDQLVEKLGQYASLRTTEDSANNESLSREGKLESLLVRVGEAFSFVAPELQAASDEVFEGFLKHPALSEWTVPLKKFAGSSRTRSPQARSVFWRLGPLPPAGMEKPSPSLRMWT